MSEVLLSEATKYSRNDAEFFLRKHIALEKSIQSKAYKKLSDVCILHDGPFGSDVLAESYEASGLPVLRMQSITKKGVLNLDDAIFLHQSARESVKKYLAKSGEVVVTKVGFLGLPPISFDLGVNFV